MQAIEKVIMDAWADPVLKNAANQPDIPLSHQYDESQDREYQPRPPKAARVPTPIPLIMCLDAAIGLFNHLATHQHSKQIVLRRRVAEDIILPMVEEAHVIECPPEQFLCEHLQSFPMQLAASTHSHGMLLRILRLIFMPQATFFVLMQDFHRIFSHVPQVPWLVRSRF